MIKVLFVCLGNICRSPMAQIVFENLEWGSYYFKETKAPDCITKGETTYTATFAANVNSWAETQTITLADVKELGHHYDKKYIWSTDNTACTAIQTWTNAGCDENTAGHTETAEARSVFSEEHPIRRR